MAEAGARNGFTDVTAEFAAFKDFKLKWTRSFRWISFEMSDYQRNAPEHVIRSLAETVFAKIGGQDRVGNSEEVCEYLNSERFLSDNQDLFLERFRGIPQTPCGENVDLAKVYMRLVDRGLIEMDQSLAIRGGGDIEQERQQNRILEHPDEDDHCQPEIRRVGHHRERSGLRPVLPDLPRELGVRTQQERGR